MTDKIRVLAWGDYCCSTGFGTVMKNIMGELYSTGKYELDVVAINYDGGPYDTTIWPGTVRPAISALRTQGPYGDVFGRQVFLDQLASKDYDLVFILQDTFILVPITQSILEIQKNKVHPFSTIFYYPFDCAPREEWVTQVLTTFDFPVAYTEYAREEGRKYIGDLVDSHHVIYHATNTRDFYPFSPEDRKAIRESIFPNQKGQFIVTNVNRNQGRKDIPRSLMILKELRDRGVDDVFFYMHMQETDFGGSIMEMAVSMGLDPNKDLTVPNPQQFGAHSGFPIEFLNQIYGATDCFLTTTHGEGWGLSITEAMATKTPVVGPRNTSLVEILGQNNERGWTVDSGATSTDWILKENDNDRIRPLMSVEQAADAILYIKDSSNSQDVESRVQKAYDWASSYTWKSICQEWNTLFELAAKHAKSKLH